MSSSLINIAATGISAAQAAINTTSNNISNVYTAGYNRQTTSLAEVVGSGMVGSGVSVTGVNRAYDSLVTGQLRAASSTYAATSTYYDQVSQIDDLLASSDTDLSAQFSDFFTSIESMSSSAADTAARQTVIDSAGSLVNQLQSANSYLNDMDDYINQQLSASADEINGYTSQIANLNDQIVRLGSGDASNALLDQRDELISELNNIVGVTATVQDNNTVNLTFANGLTLVQGSSSYQVSAVASSADPSRTVLAYDRGTGTPSEVADSSLTTGSVGGLVTFRDSTLDDARNQLNQIALAFAGSFNTQHDKGVDLYGDTGEDFFSYDNPTVSTNTKNSGDASLSVTYTDTSAVKASDYSVKFANGAWQVTRVSDGTAIDYTSTDDGAGTTTLLFDGLSVAITGTPAANDKYTINTVSNVINSLSVAITDPGKIAAGADSDDSGESDNRNAEALLALQTSKIVGGTATLSTAYSSLVSNIGTKTANAESSSTTQSNIVDQITTKQQSLSGVNLDEEYIDLTRFQQYYQANAKVLTAAGDLFDSLLSAVN